MLFGTVQGLTEFLPVSSSAHVSLAGRLLGRLDPGAAFTAVTQLGTEAAVLIRFRNDITRVVTRWCEAQRGRRPQNDPDVRLGWAVLLGSVPIGVLGATLGPVIKGPLRDPRITAAMLVGVAGVMDLAERRGSGTKSLTDLDMRDALGYGTAQACALIPGVSRSGGTIAAGLLMGYRIEDATRYSFLLAIPAVLASGLQQLLDIADEDAPDWPFVGVATAASFGVGYAVIGWMLRVLAEHGVRPFVLYRIGLGAVIGALLAADALPRGATATERADGEGLE